MVLPADVSSFGLLSFTSFLGDKPSEDIRSALCFVVLFYK